MNDDNFHKSNDLFLWCGGTDGNAKFGKLQLNYC